MKLITIHNIKLKKAYVAPGSEIEVPDSVAEFLMEKGAAREPEGQGRRKKAQQPPPLERNKGAE